MEVLLVILIGVGIAGVIVYIARRRLKNKKPTRRQKMLALIESLPVVFKTPSNLTIRSFKQPSPEQVNAIEKGITLAMRMARFYNYNTAKCNRQNIEVMMLPSVRDYDSNGNYSPSFKVPINENDAYYNTDYDQAKGQPSSVEHWILAAEQVVDYTIEPDMRRWFVAEYVRDFDNMAIAVFNGADHTLTYHNDMDKFTHTEGGANHFHPINFVPVDFPYLPEDER